MVQANLKIFEELTWFLQMITTDASWRSFFTQKETDFSRNRQLPMATVIMMILDFFKRSLDIEIQEFFRFVKQQKGPSTSAFCQQRQKLSPDFFLLWNRLLVEQFYECYGEEVNRWKGFIVVAADGSTTSLPPQPCVTAHFGTQKNRHSQVPMAQILQLYDVLNHIILWGGIYPCGTPEATILAANRQQVPKDGLLVLDRGFPSFALMFLFLTQPSAVRFVIRCKTDFNKKVKAFVRSPTNSKTEKFQVTYKAKKFLEQMGYSISNTEEIKVRMVKVSLSSGQTEVLLTNLYEEDLYEVEDFMALYGLRWEIETCYDRQKNKMQLEQFSGYTLISIVQDYYACLFVLNVQALITKQCSSSLQRISACRKYRYKINTNLSLGAMKHYIVGLFDAEQLPSVLACLQAEFERNVVPIRPGRHYKHKRKFKTLQGKYHAFTNYKRAI
jgi:hypothetical protein